MKYAGIDASKRIRTTRRKIQWAVVRGLLIPILTGAFLTCVLLGLGHAPSILSSLSPTTTPTPTPVPSPAADLVVGRSELDEAGSEVQRALTVTNGSGITTTCYLQFSASIGPDTVRLHETDTSSQVEIDSETRRGNLGEFPPQAERGYHMVVYRRAPSLEPEPQFTLNVVDEFGVSLDEHTIEPGPSLVMADLTVISPTSTIQQTGLEFKLNFAPTIEGTYVLACYDAERTKQARSDPLSAGPDRPVHWPCPAERGQPGSWSASVYPSLSNEHPDVDAELDPVASEPFQVTAAEYSVKVSRTLVFDPDPAGSVVGVHYIVTNTGNLTDVVWVSYRPGSHALTATLSLTDTSGQPFSATLPVTGPISLLPEKQSLNVQQAIEIEIIIQHDAQPASSTHKTLTEPIEFAIVFISHEGQGKSAEQHETIKELP